jgi:hypothetical protein
MPRIFNYTSADNESVNQGWFYRARCIIGVLGKLVFYFSTSALVLLDFISLGLAPAQDTSGSAEEMVTFVEISSLGAS